MEQTLPILDLEYLRTFMAIAETGSFTKAAMLIGRSPSAVSMQVKKLEEKLQASLFVRDARNVSLTEPGEKLLSCAKQILALSNEAVAQFVTPDLHGAIKVGAPHDLAERMLPTVLKRLEANYPSILVDVVSDTSEGLLRRIERGQLDLAIVNFAKGGNGGPGEKLTEEKTVWVGAKYGTAYTRDPLPLALYGEGCIWRTPALKQLEEEGRAYRTAYLSTNTMMQRAAVVSDLAIAPLPASYVTDDMVNLGKEFGFAELPSFEIRLVTATDMTAALEVVRDLFKEAIATR